MDAACCCCCCCYPQSPPKPTAWAMKNKPSGANKSNQSKTTRQGLIKARCSFSNVLVVLEVVVVVMVVVVVHLLRLVFRRKPSPKKLVVVCCSGARISERRINNEHGRVGLDET